MLSLIERLERRLARELRYCAGMLTMYEERHRVYQADLNRSFMRGDSQQMAEITADLATFQQEIERMQRRQARAMARRALLRDGESRE